MCGLLWLCRSWCRCTLMGTMDTNHWETFLDTSYSNEGEPMKMHTVQESFLIDCIPCRLYACSVPIFLLGSAEKLTGRLCSKRIIVIGALEAAILKASSNTTTNLQSKRLLRASRDWKVGSYSTHPIFLPPSHSQSLAPPHKLLIANSDKTAIQGGNRRWCRAAAPGARGVA